MQVTIQTENGQVRKYEFINRTALELFVESLPRGWMVVQPQEAQAA